LIVAYDLRYASDHFPGIGTHAFCLLDGMLALPDPLRVVAIWNPRLTNSRFDFDSVRRDPRVQWFETASHPRSYSTSWTTGRLLRATRPDVYFSPFYLLPWSANCPRVLTLHDVLHLRVRGSLGARRHVLYRIALRGTAHAEAVVTSSEASRREIVDRLGIPAQRVHLARPGVAPHRATAPASRPLSVPEGPFALVVGINRPHKNLETLARAWARFGNAPPLRLVGVGPEDPRYPGLAELARRHGARCVTALGRVAESELEWLYRHATLTLFPTLAEGFGFPLLEAMALGSPAVTSDLAVLREIGDGVARFVPPIADEAWAAAVQALAGDPGTREAMIAAGRSRAAAFTYDRTASACLAVLRAVARPGAS
jgi:glycosyltransferase involved in cell wall biosynthesis